MEDVIIVTIVARVLRHLVVFGVVPLAARVDITGKVGRP
jgi:hypothetical protein